MKSKIDTATRAVRICQKQYSTAEKNYMDAQRALIFAEDRAERVDYARSKLETTYQILEMTIEKLAKAREELLLLEEQAIEADDTGEMDDSGDEWSDTPVVHSSGGAVERVRSMSSDSRYDDGVEEEEEDLEDSSNPDGDSKEEDNLFVENDESEETSKGNAGFQGEFILIIPTSIDNKLYIVDERQKYNESKEEIEIMFLEERDAKILYEDSPYNALLLEHLLTMPASVNFFDNVNYEGMVLKA